MERETDKSILDIKLEDVAYSSYDNFKAPGELMVTITLHEYRELIENNAVREAEVRKLLGNILDLKEERAALKEQLDKLNKENVLLKGQLQASVKDGLNINYRLVEDLYNELCQKAQEFRGEHWEGLQENNSFEDGVMSAFLQFQGLLKDKMEVFKDE